MTLTRRQLLWLGLAGGTSLIAPLLRPTRSSAAPAAARPEVLQWLATADGGSGDQNQRAVGSAMAALHRRQPVDLVILGGDNIYNDGDIRKVEEAFERPYRDLLQSGVPFHAVLGNHDIRTDNGNGELAYAGFGMKGRWYSLRQGPVEFFLIDTNVNAPWQHQLPWLRRSLADSNAPWKVVVGHHPIHSSGFYGDDPEAIARLSPHFQRHRVQLFINGHEHNYERSLPIDGTTYLSVGNGGAALRPVVPGPRSARAVSIHGFASFRADARRLSIQAWDTGGRRLDQAELNLDGSLS
jgi:3',5'-cyclic AMP phosphodiesterase CpdA